MDLKSAADILISYVQVRMSQGKSFNQTWHDLARNDPKFRGMIEGYTRIRSRNDHKEGHNEERQVNS